MTRKRGWYWPWFVVAALAFTVGVNVVMMVAAAGAAVVEPDYYHKAVAWDQAMARAAESARLGWRPVISLRRATADSAWLVVEMTGVDGLPVAGARLSAELIHNIEASHPVRATMTEGRAGRYEATVPVRRTGLWEVRLEGRRGTERFVSSQRTEAFVTAPAEDR